MPGAYSSTIAQYRLDTVIGRGSTGIVYRGYDMELGRPVAVKLLTATRLDFSARARFRCEARLLSRLTHPNIATLFEFSNDHGVEYLVMELVDGKTLRALLKSAPIPAARVATLGAQLARGLAAAHHAGVIHRDIKPSNLCLTPDGVLKILDFGVAISPVVTASTDTTQSAPGILPSLAGTLQYMAPERLRGSRADARTDIFSAGMVLYEMACGQPPHADPHPVRLIEAILHGTLRRPRRILRSIPRALERAILKALARDPDRRYQSAADMAADLERIRPGEGQAESGYGRWAVAVMKDAGRRLMAAATRA